MFSVLYRFKTALFRLLEVQNVSLRFGGNTVLRNITMKVERGEVYGLIGPNGSGKTTLLNVVSGVYHPTAGEIWLKGVNTTNLPPYSDALRCMVRTFQIPKLWRKLSVLENVLVACYGKRPKMTNKEILEIAKDYISIFGLGHMTNEPSSTLSVGQSKLLETARAFACHPEIVLLDEPLAGVAPSLIPTMLAHIKHERERGVSVLIVSHVITGLVDLCDRLAAMSSGVVIAEGKPREVLAAQSVIDSYLGGSTVLRS